MKMMKGFEVFVVIYAIVSSQVCTACFSVNEYTEFTSKTGSQFVKDCLCAEKGYSVQYLTWLDPDGQPIQPHGPDTSTYLNVYTEVQPQNAILRLIVGSISKSMAGNYTCKTNFEGKTYTKTYKIEAYDSLYFVNTSKDQYAILGENSLIRCEVRATIEYFVEWYRIDGTDQERLENGTKYTVLPDGLIIKNVSKNDDGVYQCTAVDKVENDMTENNIKVQVAVRPVITDLRVNSPPEIIISGDNVTIECVADGTPYPEYFWNKTADSLGNPLYDANETWTQVVNTIKFENIQKDDAGTYECLAANKVDNVSRRITIDVTVPPVITSLENVTVLEGSETQIVCKTTGVPLPQILISYTAEGLENDTRIASIVKNTTDTSELYLTMINVSTTFEGIYSCSASNAAGNATQDMYLTVFYKPFFPKPEETIWGWDGNTVNMSCEHESNPPSTIVWKFQGNEIDHETTTAEHDQVNRLLQETGDNSQHYLALTVDNMTMYGEYECIASNDYGKTTKRIHLKEAFKPAAIRNATVMNTTATTVTFQIQGPDPTDNSPVHGYTAEYDLVQNYNITSVHLSRTCGLDRNFVIDRLQPNSTYSIKFAAQNEVGVGDWSEPLEFVTPETSAPEPPVLEVQNSQGMLRWRAPEANGDPIDHYSVEFCPFFGQIINTTLCQKVTTSSTEFILDKLDRNTKYSFQVRAHNSHGYSDFRYEEITTPERLIGVGMLSAGATIGICVVVVFLCLLVLDLLLLCWRRQGIIASCFFRKNKKKTNNLHSRDKKGLLGREGERTSDSLTNPNNGHRELVYNKTTGVITGKHSSV